MCLIVFALNVSEEYPLIFLSNRDEFYQRPAQNMHWWEGNKILAGKDLQAGGTWLAVHKNKKIAAVTNYRDPHRNSSTAPSRGQIPVDILVNDCKDFKEYIHQNESYWNQMNGFNLLYFDGKQMHYYSNISKEIQTLNKGIYALSNAFLDTPWPKALSAKSLLEEKIQQKKISTTDLFTILSNQEYPAISNLPNTGVGMEMEKMLSPIFITSPIYGTRTHTIITLNQNKELEITENQSLTQENQIFRI